MNRSSRPAALLVTACLISSFGFANGSQTSSDLPEGVSAGDWSQIQSLIAAQRHEFQATPGGHVASNPGLRATARFDGDSAAIELGDSERRFGLALKSYGFASDLITVDKPTFGACADGQELTYDWSDEVSEWWLNDSRGFEHGFNVWKRPAVADDAGTQERRGPLTFTLDVLGTLAPEVNGARTGLILRDADGNAALRYDGLSAFDADGVPLDSWLEVKGRTLRICVDDAGAAYPLVVDPILQQAYLKASTTDANDFFGTSGALSGDTMIVGARFEDSSATGVNGDESDNSATDSGAAYVFVRSGGIWSQQAYLKASNSAVDDSFGVSVAVSGDTVVVGAPGEDSNSTGVNGNDSNNATQNSGAAYVFVRSGGTWSQQAYLKASNTGANDGFGDAVAISGDTVVVGALGEGSSATGVNGDESNNSFFASGAAYVFVRSGDSWSQQAYLKASNSGCSDLFGSSVSVSENTVVIGAVLESSSATGVNGDESDNAAFESGAAYVFFRSGGSWIQQAYLKASNTDAQDFFGGSVSVSGDTAVVGAVCEDSAASGVNGDESNNDAISSGAAYVFVRSGGSWIQQAYLKASNTGAGDGFAPSVAVSADTVVVSAPGESSNATGVNGDESNNDAFGTGAAYVFVRSGGSWSQQAYLKASNAEALDALVVLGVSGDTVVVGAPAEDSGATGVNGDESDNSVANSGAVYVFTGLGSPDIGDLVCVGAPNSTGFGGTLSALGSSVVSDNSLTLEIASCPATRLGLVLTSSSNGGPIATVSLGGSSLCIANFQTASFPAVLTDQSGAATQVVDLTAIPTNLVGTAAALPGDTYYFQFWHRDTVGGTPTSNLTSAISVLFE